MRDSGSEEEREKIKQCTGDDYLYDLHDDESDKECYHHTVAFAKPSTATSNIVCMYIEMEAYICIQSRRI